MTLNILASRRKLVVAWISIPFSGTALYGPNDGRINYTVKPHQFEAELKTEATIRYMISLPGIESGSNRLLHSGYVSTGCRNYEGHFPLNKLLLGGNSKFGGGVLLRGRGVLRVGALIFRFDI